MRRGIKKMVKFGWRKENVSFSGNEFLCTKCNKKYRTKALYNQHKRRVHEVKK